MVRKVGRDGELGGARSGDGRSWPGRVPVWQQCNPLKPHLNPNPSLIFLHGSTGTCANIIGTGLG